MSTTDGNGAEFYPEVTSEVLADSPQQNKRTKYIALIVGVLAVLIAGGVFAFSKLSGGGVQPEELLPADTVAFAKLDLNPSAGQKIEFVRFISHFSGTFKDFNSNDPIGSVLKQYNATDSLNWDEIKPWVGNRFAIAGVQSGSGVTPVVVLGVSNEAQMKYYLAKHQPTFKYVIKQGFAILADSQATLDIVAASPTHLNTNATYKSDIAALGGSQVAVLWGDLKPLLKAAGSTIDSLASDRGLGSVSSAISNTNGRVVLGIHFTSNSIAATFLTRGMSGSGNNIFNAAETDLGGLPEETLAGVSIAGLGDLLTSSSNDQTLSSALDYIGLSLSQLRALLSGPLTIVILPETSTSGSPLLALKLTPKDKTVALRTLRSLLSDGSALSSIASQVVTDGSDIYVGTDAQALQSVMNTIKQSKNHLRDSAAYRQAIPNPGVFLAYVNLQKLLPTLNIKGDALKFSALALVSASDKSLSGSSKTKLTITLK